MFAHLTAVVATVAGRGGFIRVANYDAPPGAVSHIHTVDAVDEHDPADCGYGYHSGDAGPFSAICAYCADQHAAQAWIQRCRSRTTGIA